MIPSDIIIFTSACNRFTFPHRNQQIVFLNILPVNSLGNFFFSVFCKQTPSHALTQQEPLSINYYLALQLPRKLLTGIRQLQKQSNFLHDTTWEFFKHDLNPWSQTFLLLLNFDHLFCSLSKFLQLEWQLCCWCPGCKDNTLSANIIVNQQVLELPWSWRNLSFYFISHV